MELASPQGKNCQYPELVREVAAELEDIYHSKRAYTVLLNVSGCKKNDLLIHVADGMLRLEKTDNRKMELLFSFIMPADVDTKTIKAIFLQHKLKIVLRRNGHGRSQYFTLNGLLKALF